MATFGSDSKGAYAIVQSGDTLSEICYAYFNNGTAAKYNAVAKLNGIPNANRIYVGQKIYLTGTAGANASKTGNTNSNKVTINYFGRMSYPADSRTLYVGWTWSKDSDTEKYEYEWEYSKKGVGSTEYDKAKWWTGNKSDTTDQELTYDIPDEAIWVRFRVRAVAKTDEKPTGKKGETKKVSRFPTTDWTNFKKDGSYSVYNATTSLPPPAIEAPKAELDESDPLKLNLSVSSVDLTPINRPTHVVFRVIRVTDTKSSVHSTSGNIALSSIAEDNRGYASWPCKLSAGSEYKSQCKALRISNGVTLASGWSAYSSDEVRTAPLKPKPFKDCLAKKSSTDNTISAYLSWAAVESATKYEVEYTTNKEYFDSNTTKPQSVTDIEDTHLTIDRLVADGSGGATYYFRYRAVNDGGESEWSDPSSLVLGKPPAAPTTWSSVNSATVGSPLTLYWVHSSADGSSQTYANLELEIYEPIVADGKTSYEYKTGKSKQVANSTDPDERDKTSSFDVASFMADDPEISPYYAEGMQLRWRVQTAGITQEFGEWSTMRMVDIHAEPKITISVKDGTNTIDSTFDTLGSFPITISTTTTPSTQAPTSFHLSIISNDIYETVDSVGNDKIINVGDEVYSKHFDQNTDLDKVVLSAGDVDLESSMRYTIKCVVSMNSGLKAQASFDFTVSWEEVSYTPNAFIEYDSERYVTQIHPYCEIYDTIFHEVTYSEATHSYTSTGIAVSVLEGSAIVGAFTTDGDQVYSGSSSITIDEEGNVNGGEEILYHEVTTGTLVEGVTLSVYRREFDGTFTEIAKGIDNTKNTYVTDPHPALDYARYRIVASTDATGAVSYYDTPSYAINEPAIIIQWDEAWSNYDAVGDDIPADPPWSGSLIRLPYNVDVSDSYNPDVALVKYAGRKRPVSYHGTQLGESSTWNTTIPKEDKDTIYALRRLAIWSGNAYVREPSGTGYWAHVVPSFPQKHLEMTVAVTLTITRVEGGV